jgi:hypothetical protein
MPLPRARIRRPFFFTRLFFKAAADCKPLVPSSTSTTTKLCFTKKAQINVGLPLTHYWKSLYTITGLGCYHWPHAAAAAPPHPPPAPAAPPPAPPPPTSAAAAAAAAARLSALCSSLGSTANEQAPVGATNRQVDFKTPSDSANYAELYLQYVTSSFASPAWRRRPVTRPPPLQRLAIEFHPQLLSKSHQRRASTLILPQLRCRRVG